MESDDLNFKIFVGKLFVGFSAFVGDIMIEQAVQLLFSFPGGKLTAAIFLFVVFSILLYVVYRVIFAILRRVASHTKTDLDDILFKKMEDPARLLVIFTSLYIALNYTYPDIKIGSASLGQLYVVALMLNVAFALDRFVSTLLEWYMKEIAPKTESKMDDELIPVIEKIIKAAIYAVAFTMMLSNLGIEITPLLAGLGIASLAVALALQDSLGNFFAGVNISIDRPLRKGDYIITDGGIEGVVQEIGWRSTKILNYQNNIITIPNIKLAQSTIINFYKPDELVMYTNTIGISYEDDPDKVTEAIRAAILRVAKKQPVIDPSAGIMVRLDSFGDFSMNFRYIYGLRDYRKYKEVADAVNREILKEFRAQGITIPYPVRTLYIHSAPPRKEKSEKKMKKKKK